MEVGSDDVIGAGVALEASVEDVLALALEVATSGTDAFEGSATF